MVKSISIIGLGFVGLSLAVVSADKGYNVIGVDTNKPKLAKLKQGHVDFFEQNLPKYLNKAIKSKRIEFTDNLQHAILASSMTFLCVGTPLKNSSIDLSFVIKAAKDINSILKKKKTYHTLVVKSTVIPQTTRDVILPIFSTLIKKKRVDVFVNPEFLQESRAIHDVLNPHMIVIGKYTKNSKALDVFYKNFYKKMPPIIYTDITSAELIKYANNAFLATKISFINSFANLCQNLPGTDITTISEALGLDPRIGPMFLQAGPGFGGSCLPKDLNALINFSKQFDGVNSLFKAVNSVNETQPKKIVHILSENNLLSGTTISILGLSFKKNTDDIRSAVSTKLVKLLLRYDVKIRVHDPMAIPNFKSIFNNKIKYSLDIKSCLDGSDCCIVLTEWDEYKMLKPNRIFSLLKNPNVIDARRVFNPSEFAKFNFHAIGLGSSC